jgi:hypothetical protein
VFYLEAAIPECILLEVTMRRACLILCLMAAFPATVLAQANRVPAQQRGYLHPQLVQDVSGNVGMLWVRPSAEGHDLFLARRQSNGSFVDPVRVNSVAGDVLFLGHPEGRPGIASGPGGRVAASWFDRSGQLHVALSTDGGQSFGRAVAVSPGHARPEHAFSDVEFDANGDLFVTWIDVTDAPAGQEEPAQLYVARVNGERSQTVRNLTGDFAESICGCCRPDLSINGRELMIGFRMIEDGFRDIHRVRLGSDLRPVQPERMGPALWRINACPMAGPAVSRDFVWFIDGSTGQRRLMEASSPTATPVQVRAATVSSPSAPRLIEGSEGPRWMLYLPGSSGGQVLAREGGVWRVLVDKVPPFCTDIVLVEGQLLMIGERGGVLWMQAEGVN